MGTWGPRPWENDGGADWFGDFMAATHARERVMETIENEVDKGFGVDYQAVRAAISTFVYFGRIYI